MCVADPRNVTYVSPQVYIFQGGPVFTIPTDQPRSQGLSSYRSSSLAPGGKMRDPGNEVADRHVAICTYFDFCFSFYLCVVPLKSVN